MPGFMELHPLDTCTKACWDDCRDYAPLSLCGSPLSSNTLVCKDGYRRYHLKGFGSRGEASRDGAHRAACSIRVPHRVSHGGNIGPLDKSLMRFLWHKHGPMSQVGRGLVQEALRFLQLEPPPGAPEAEPSSSRLALLQNPAEPEAPPSALQQLALAALALPTRRPKIAGES